MTTKKTTNNATHIATDSEGELITHLEALRTTLMRCLLALGIMLFPSFLFTPACLDFLVKIPHDNAGTFPENINLQIEGLLAEYAKN